MKKVSKCRRNHIEILSDILELCKTPQTKTNILHSTNTSFALLESYLLKLQMSSLLGLESETKRYFTTEEGQKFIEAWLYLKSMLYPDEFPMLMKNKKCIIRNNNLIEIRVTTPELNYFNY